MFNAEFTTGNASVILGDNPRMDAAIVMDGTLAGLEIEASKVTVHDRANPSYAYPLTLSVTMNRQTMTQLAFLLLEKLGTPAFNEREWRIIAEALDRLGEHDTERAAMADSIREAYNH